MSAGAGVDIPLGQRHRKTFGEGSIHTHVHDERDLPEECAGHVQVEAVDEKQTLIANSRRAHEIGSYCPTWIVFVPVILVCGYETVIT